MNKKYKLTNETITINGHTLHRIRALKNFSNVKKGNLGGFVESEKNLSQEDDCWVDDNGCVYENGLVFGNGRVIDNGCIAENGRVSDYGIVSGNGLVYGDGRVIGIAHIDGNVEITGTGLVKSDDDYTTVSGFGINNRTTTFFRCTDKRIRVQCGCFYGTIDEFREQVKKTRDGKIAEDYLLAADLMEKHFSE